jgi:hypothetical protein
LTAAAQWLIPLEVSSKEFSMRKMIGSVLLVGGLLAVVAGVIYAQMGVHVAGNILGLFSPVTAILFFGGAVAAFVGFALVMVIANHEAR